MTDNDIDGMTLAKEQRMDDHPDNWWFKPPGDTRPTPETDAALVDGMPKPEEWSQHYLDLATHARRLERQLAESREELQLTKDRLEREEMCHAGCGVIANANTTESLANIMEDIHPGYYSASMQDVTRAVQREIDLREQRDKLVASLKCVVRSAPASGPLWHGSPEIQEACTLLAQIEGGFHE